MHIYFESRHNNTVDFIHDAFGMISRLKEAFSLPNARNCMPNQLIGTGERQSRTRNDSHSGLGHNSMDH
jgi:hypothetical protein